MNLKSFSLFLRNIESLCIYVLVEFEKGNSCFFPWNVDFTITNHCTIVTNVRDKCARDVHREWEIYANVSPTECQWYKPNPLLHITLYVHLHPLFVPHYTKTRKLSPIHPHRVYQSINLNRCISSPNSSNYSPPIISKRFQRFFPFKINYRPIKKISIFKKRAIK